jgi:hypothetical protein
MRYFPPIPSDLHLALGMICDHLEEDPQALLDEDCTYSHENCAALMRLRGEVVTRPLLAQPDDGTYAATDMIENVGSLDLEAQFNTMLKELQSTGSHLGDSTSSEKIQYFKAATQLLAKLLEMKERAGGLRRIGLFYTAVMDVMETVLTPDQRTAVMDRLTEASKDEI